MMSMCVCCAIFGSSKIESKEEEEVAEEEEEEKEKEKEDSVSFTCNS